MPQVFRYNGHNGYCSTALTRGDKRGHMVDFSVASVNLLGQPLCPIHKVRLRVRPATSKDRHALNEYIKENLQLPPIKDKRGHTGTNDVEACCAWFAQLG